jgi:hypothetical protein
MKAFTEGPADAVECIEGRKAMAAKARAQYVKGVKAGRMAAGKSYSSGREAGYDAWPSRR